jgi:aminoglycoside/choline kinase family phosphotransferase
MVDHGIRAHQKTSDVDAYVNIGRHLHEKGVPVPEIYSFDTFSGLVFLEDLGDIHLQQLVRNSTDLNEIVSWYTSVINLLIQMSVIGAEGFNPSWTAQTARYDRGLILEKECRYFVDSFLRDYCSMDLCFENFEDEFSFLADKALESATDGFMHRDMQSRNIMFKASRFYFIDFQGGRIGPIQYDLASLLIDPYVELPITVQQYLLTYCLEKLSSFSAVEDKCFRTCYTYCSITRNLQILGAFAHLSRSRGKRYFEKYILPALGSLARNLSACGRKAFPKLISIVERLNQNKADRRP